MIDTLHKWCLSQLPHYRLGHSFMRLWMSQALSIMGGSLTLFALSIWIFQQTRSVSDFSWMILWGTLPALVLTPWVGHFADSSDRRKIMLVSDGVACFCMAIIVLLLWSDQFKLWHLYVIQAVMSVAGAFQGPAAYAAINALVPKNQMGRANGMFALSSAIAQLTTPLIAAMLIGSIGLIGIVSINLFALIFAMTLLSQINLSSDQVVPPIEANMTPLGWRHTLKGFAVAQRFFLQRPAMAITYCYIILNVVLIGMVSVLVTPMVLLLYSERELALISVFGAVGVLLGGLLMISWGGPKRWSSWVFAFYLIEGMMVMVAGIATSITLLCICAFFSMLSSTTFSACIQSLWQRKIPRQILGRVFALEQFICMSALPLSAILGGMLAQHIFEPALMPNGVWFQAMHNSWFGTGAGRGTGLFLVTIGSLIVISSLFAITSRHLANLEKNVPDSY